MVGTLDGLPLHDAHRANGTRVIVRNTGLPGKPGHHEQIVRVSHDHRNAIVIPRGRLNIGRHVFWSQAHSLHGVTEGGQRGLLAQTIQFTHEIEKPAGQGSHEAPTPCPGTIGAGQRWLFE